MATLHHYIPCYRKSDNVIGLYDIITDEFKTNAGTGSFTKGSNTDVHGLPNEYQEVEYIQSSGTQYINTGYIPTMDTYARCKYEVMGYIRSIYGAIYASRGGSVGTYRSWYSFMVSNQATDYYVYQLGYENTTTHTPSSAPSGINIILQEKNKFYLNGVLVADIRLYVDPWTSNNALYLFACNPNGESANDFAVIRMYEMEIAENQFTPPTPPTNVHFVYDGNDVEHLVYNGNPVSHLVYDENNVF